MKLSDLSSDAAFIERIGRVMHSHDPELREGMQFDPWMKFWNDCEGGAEHFVNFIADIRQAPELYDALPASDKADVNEFIKLLGIAKEVESLCGNVLIPRDAMKAKGCSET